MQSTILFFYENSLLFSTIFTCLLFTSQQIGAMRPWKSTKKNHLIHINTRLSAHCKELSN